jgi:hypothetical protein
VLQTLKKALFCVLRDVLYDGISASSKALGRLTLVHPVNKNSAFYGIRKFIKFYYYAYKH